MAVVTGTILVLLSWAVAVVSCVGVGLVPSLLLSEGRWTARSLRAAMWWGLVLLTILIVGLSIALPLRSAAAAAVVLGAVTAASLVGIGMAVRARRHAQVQQSRRGLWPAVVALGVAAPVLYLALAALGPVTNYDTGLYHLGAIAYAGDFPAIPGLASLYFPFGYANAEFPLAAFLGNGPWAGEGFRLLNGLLFAMLGLDLLARAWRGRPGPGFFVLAAGAAAAFVPMVALSDYWVTSPNSDAAVLALTLVVSAYLVDVVWGSARWAADASVASALSVLLVMLRPTMAVYALSVIAVIAMVGWRRRHEGLRPLMAGGALIGAVIVLAGLVVTARDYVLSGWVQFPLSVHAFDVAWLAADPVESRTATLGAARNPADLWRAAEGWDWVGAWVGRLGSQWETYQVALLLLVAAGFALLAARSAAGGLRWRELLLAVAPSIVMSASWWAFTPPSFRFAWGPLFTLGTIPLGWSLARLDHGTRTQQAVGSPWQWLTAVALVVPTSLVVTFSLTTRFEWASLTQERTWAFGIPYVLAPVPSAATTSVTLNTGLTILQPVDSDQCWSAYPLCTPQLFSDIALRGVDISDGFVRVP